ncbi:concanavalin A-like lectin/glucanase domain-containing protein [Aspergillus welwitschiae]|uniref:Concanavalin A-like lectin/glucanase domain-containing protein n=2 Tax=Aspergillus TaxID=5052 RepID=A0A3F3Q5T0_9EURO|nr:concanavalin A-like lectin/glucanase domain-containing protein [Aspergillus welwitschiae]RDH34066.1 concanavalin A-like lectin/glucanase domain-containing protein [Aspergillus welwitschiae]
MMKIPVSLLSLVAAATAQSVIESSSFGFGQTLSADGGAISGWQTGGESHTPDILSNKIILTPPYPGNTRGFAWSQTPVSQSEWTAEFQFRATGPERGGGNLQLWYAKDGKDRIGTSSIYTVNQFDGFALVIDSHGGRGGSVRGFLNDGTTDYKSHRSVDSLAFGHCDYPYRNLGRPSTVRLKHTKSVFEVTVDDKLCFSTDKVALPTGNVFGLTAATPENPDSFEVFKFVLQSAESGTGSAVPVQQQNTNQQPIAAQQQAVPQQQQQAPPVNTGFEQQFADLSNRVQVVNQATDNIIRELGSQDTKAANRQVELLQKLASKEQIASLDARLQRMEQMLQTIQRDLEGKDYHSRFNQLQETLRSSHLSLTENLLGVITSSAPRMGFFICMIIAFQGLLAVAYIIYKRRRANMPKKFL